MNPVYQALPREVFLKAGDNELFHAIAEHNFFLLGARHHGCSAVNRIDNAPLQFKEVVYLWHFWCEAGGNGLTDLLNFNLTCYDMWQTLVALEQIGAQEIIGQLIKGVPGIAHFNALHPQVLAALDLSNFLKPIDWEAVGEIDRVLYELCGEPLQTLAANYIRVNQKYL